MFPTALLVAEVLYVADEIAADRALHKSRCIYGYRGRTSPPPGHAPHDFMHHTHHIVFLEPRQKAIQRGVIRHRAQLESRAQLGVLTQPHLSFAKDPVLVTHQT